jgi:hypothetical protein
MVESNVEFSVRKARNRACKPQKHVISGQDSGAAQEIETAFRPDFSEL